MTCKIFEGGKDKDGYGWQRSHGERKAHRVAYVKANGPVPLGLWVLHTCDNPSCVNPEHLYAGTPTQNMQDRRDRGRDSGWQSRDMSGDKNPNVKLTAEDVKTIRENYKWGMGPTLAKQYNVSVYTIRRLMQNESWVV